MDSLLQKLVEHMLKEESPQRAIILYPNSGEEWDAANETWLVGTGMTKPEDFANGIWSSIERVYNIFGGLLALF